MPGRPFEPLFWLLGVTLLLMAADADAAALLFVGRRLSPPAAGVVMLDLDAVNDDGQRLPCAVRELLSRLDSPLLALCGPGGYYRWSCTFRRGSSGCRCGSWRP